MMNEAHEGRVDPFFVLLVCIAIPVAIALVIGRGYPLIKGALAKPAAMPAPPAKTEEILGINTFGMYIAEPVIRAADGNMYRFEESWQLESEPGEIENTPCQQKIVRRFENLTGRIITCLKAGQAGEMSSPPTSYYALTADGEIWAMEIESPQSLVTICLLGLLIPIGLVIGLAYIFSRRRS
jgi:hypothetical protein